MPRDLSLLDEQVRHVEAPADLTWTAARGYAEELAAAPHAVLGRLLGAEPPSGFTLAESERPGELVLSGRHRFATYRLVFRVDPDEHGSLARALSYAEFPGLHGRAYRWLLLVSTGHRRAIRQMLGVVARRAEVSARATTRGRRGG